MFRNVEKYDAAEIAEIYNHFVENTDISFETEPLSAEEMWTRIENIRAHCPYIVWEQNGKVAGFCYAHPWKDRSAYRLTLETTVYIAPSFCRQGIGTRMMEELIIQSRRRGYKALIACITAGNEASEAMHRRLGFKQVSHFEKVGEKFGRQLDVVDYQLLL